MKYTIELTNKQKAQMDCMMEIVHRYVGFNPKLEPIENSWESELERHRKQAYTKGYNSAINDYNAMYEWLHDCFVDFKKFLLEKGFYTDEKFSEGFVVGQLMYDLICDHDIAEVISEFKKWQEEKKKAKEESIQVGDVVKFNEKCHSYDHVKSREFLVLHIFDNGLVTLLYDNGDTGAAEISLLDKTDKHVGEVEQLLSKLKERE